MTWYYESRVFNGFSIAILRLASWDFEVSSDDDVPIPFDSSSIRGWRIPEESRYWFHCFLVMLEPDLETSLHNAVARVKAFIEILIVYLAKCGLS